MHWLSAKFRSILSAKTSPTATNKLKIAHTADTARGATWMAEQLRELKSLGHSVASIIPEEGDLSKKLDSFGVHHCFHKIGFPWHSRQALPSLKNIYSLAKHFTIERYDVVHHHLYPSMIVSRFAAWIADVPVRLSMIPGPFYMDAEIPQAVELGSCWMDSRVIVSCTYSGQQYRAAGVPATNLELVYYGADESNFSPTNFDAESARSRLIEELELDEDVLLVGMVAYFYAPLTESRHYPKSVWNKSMKGHETLIEAVPQILSVCPKARFLFVGDGWGEPGQKLMEDLKASVAAKGLSKYIHFVGHRENVPEILSSLSVSLQLSRSENLGGTIESLLMSRPLVATRVGGMVDSVRHEQTGLLVEMDNTEELAAAISRLLGDAEFAQRLGNSGRELMLNEFSLKSTVRKLNELYQQCYSETQHSGYRWHVIAWRSLIAPFLLLAILSLQFRYEIEGMSGPYFTDLYRPVIEFQNRISTLIQPLFRVDGNTSFASVMSYTARIFPALLFWLAYPFALTKKRMRDRIGYRLSQAGRILPMYHPVVVFEAIASLFCVPAPRLAKRLFDITAASTLIVFFLPVFALARQSARKAGKPVFELQTVMGKRNHTFAVYSFGDWKVNQSIYCKLAWLPLLINVFKGDMSIVGTRIRPKIQLSDRPENHPTAWTTRPGLTGWCHMNVTGDLDFDCLNGLDVLYMVNWSPLLDVKILLKTILFRLKNPTAGLFFEKYWMMDNHTNQTSRAAEKEVDLTAV
jgi:glycosyltransferase involved in cell wall biosynthesis/lipopolysaccharide/colanic/teichoic acid biosynthesis glycosyltransferase